MTRLTIPNISHRANLGAMFVSQAHRGAGVAAQLVERLAAEAAQQGIEQIHLTVTVGNDCAERFYRRHGFIAYGVEPRGMKLDGRHYDLILMVRRLSVLS